MMDPTTIYKFGKARQRELETEFAQYPVESATRTDERRLSAKHRLILAPGSFTLAALMFAQALAR